MFFLSIFSLFDFFVFFENFPFLPLRIFCRVLISLQFFRDISSPFYCFPSVFGPKIFIFPAEFLFSIFGLFYPGINPRSPHLPPFSGFSGFFEFFLRFLAPSSSPRDSLSSWCPGFCLSLLLVLGYQAFKQRLEARHRPPSLATSSTKARKPTAFTPLLRVATPFALEPSHISRWKVYRQATPRAAERLLS